MRNHQLLWCQISRIWEASKYHDRWFWSHRIFQHRPQLEWYKPNIPNHFTTFSSQNVKIVVNFLKHSPDHSILYHLTLLTLKFQNVSTYKRDLEQTLRMRVFPLWHLSHCQRIPHLPVPYMFGIRATRGSSSLIYWLAGELASKYIYGTGTWGIDISKIIKHHLLVSWPISQSGAVHGVRVSTWDGERCIYQHLNLLGFGGILQYLRQWPCQRDSKQSIAQSHRIRCPEFCGSGAVFRMEIVTVLFAVFSTFIPKIERPAWTRKCEKSPRSPWNAKSVKYLMQNANGLSNNISNISSNLISSHPYLRHPTFCPAEYQEAPNERSISWCCAPRRPQTPSTNSLLKVGQNIHGLWFKSLDNQIS